MSANLKLVYRTKPKQRVLRPFETSYAGARSGYSNTRESAVNAAIGHIMTDGYTAATITDRRSGDDVAWLKLSRDKKSVRVTTVHVIKRTK